MSDSAKSNFRKRIALLLLFIAIVGGGLAWYGRQNETRLWALDGATGAIRWSRALATDERDYAMMPPVTNAPLVVGWVERRATGEPMIALVAWDRLTGAERWRWPLPTGRQLDYEDRLLATTSRIYLVMVDSNEQRTLVALDAATGQEAWQLPGVVTYVTLPPVADQTALPDADDSLVVSYTEQQFILSRRAAADGVERWQVVQPLGDNHLGLRPLVAATTQAAYLFRQRGVVTKEGNWEGDGVYDVQGYALTDGAKTITYEHQGQDPVFYVGPTVTRASGYTLLGLNETTGAVQWQYSIPEPEKPDQARYVQAVTALPDLLYLVVGPNSYDELGSLVALNPADGQERWRAQVVDEGFSLLAPPPATTTTIGINGPDGFVAVDRQSGAVRWTFASDAFLLIPGADENTFYFMDRAMRWRTWLTLLRQ